MPSTLPELTNILCDSSRLAPKSFCWHLLSPGLQYDCHILRTEALFVPHSIGSPHYSTPCRDSTRDLPPDRRQGPFDLRLLTDLVPNVCRGRASNGFVLSDHLSHLLGLSAQSVPANAPGASWQYGANFAVGGSGASPETGPGALPDQVTRSELLDICNVVFSALFHFCVCFFLLCSTWRLRSFSGDSAWGTAGAGNAFWNGSLNRRYAIFFTCFVFCFVFVRFSLFPNLSFFPFYYLLAVDSTEAFPKMRRWGQVSHFKDVWFCSFFASRYSLWFVFCFCFCFLWLAIQGLLSRLGRGLLAQVSHFDMNN